VVRLTFPSIAKADLVRLVNEFLQARSTDKIRSRKIDENSIAFFKNLKTETGVFVIPTKIGVIQSYDFTRDINGIVPDLKARIV